MGSLQDIDLAGLGRFTDTAAGFRVEEYHLEEPWPYIYACSRVLLKVDQRGPDYVQFAPPGGSVFFRRERFQAYPSIFVWVRTAPARGFTNFFRPTIGIDPSTEPDEFCCDYAPERALYHVSRDSISCDTEILVLPDSPVVVMTCRMTNTGSQPVPVDIVPVMRPHFAAGSLAPWDAPALYQKTAYSNEKYQVFDLELRSPAGLPEMREYALLVSDLPSPDAVEVDYERFVGRGTFENPDFTLSIDPGRPRQIGDLADGGFVNGKQGVIAMSKRLVLGPGETFEFAVAMGSVDGPPDSADVDALAACLNEKGRTETKEQIRQKTAAFLGKRRITTPDKAFSRYVNEWLPLQLGWVNLLDRGWPTGMRGVRDNAQDVTALVPLDPAHARAAILTLFGVQRSDGWFPRQYSTKGRHGTHDLRSYVDGGVWVWELLHDYLCCTRDRSIIRQPAPWLDSDNAAMLMDHVRALARYYIAPQNLGEHGLCLIREGDWNDSVNRAGLEGRGESVMVSCQAVMMLLQMAAVLPRIAPESKTAESEAAEFTQAADRLKECILTHALNSEGYLNGVFNDDGRWVFSPNDPDGRRRVNIPVNAFGIISGVLDGENARRAVGILRSLKQADGWPLFWPPIGDPPIPRLGRIGQGDLAPGLGENGTPYNHGSHGFFGRAAAVIGDGDLLAEILRYMLPYDQQAHPVQRARTAPYGVVNHWKTAPGVEGRGGDCFLSGSISTALRNVYNGLFGIKPTLDGLALDPVLPSDWDEASAEFDHLGTRVHLTYRRSKDAPRLLVDGEEVTFLHTDPVLNKECLCIPDSFFSNKTRVECVYYTR